VGRLYRDQAASFILPASATAGAGFFRERIGGAPIQVLDGENWDSIAHADLALTASGTVTVEAALLGTPMVTFYKVTTASWIFGRMLVRTPFYSMVNLIAGRAVVPELMQSDLTGERLATEAQRLLRNDGACAQMRTDLAEVAALLSGAGRPMTRASAIIQEIMEGQFTHVSYS
jgi:lipid-A-disaccharide synthase